MKIDSVREKSENTIDKESKIEESTSEENKKVEDRNEQ